MPALALPEQQAPLSVDTARVLEVFADTYSVLRQLGEQLPPYTAQRIPNEAALQGLISTYVKTIPIESIGAGPVSLPPELAKGVDPDTQRFMQSALIHTLRVTKRRAGAAELEELLMDRRIEIVDTTPQLTTEAPKRRVRTRLSRRPVRGSFLGVNFDGGNLFIGSGPEDAQRIHFFQPADTEHPAQALVTLRIS